jgi:hypothetical protein
MGPSDLVHVLRHPTAKERPPELLVGLQAADAGADLLPGAADRNRDYLEAPDASEAPRVRVDGGVDPLRAALLFDPQTGGGLLFAAPQPMAAAIEAAFRTKRQPLWRVGRVAAGSGGRVR